MGASLADFPRFSQFRTPSGQSRILHSLSNAAIALAAIGLEDFTEQLSAALLHLSETSNRPVEAHRALDAFSLLRTEADRLRSAIARHLPAVMAQEIERTLGASPVTETGEGDLSLVSFEEMESKVLLNNASQSLEKSLSDQLNGLNLRLGWLMERDDFPTSANPFRPEIFLLAVYRAWHDIDDSIASCHVVVRLLGPELFLPLDAILSHLNEALIERNVLPDLAEAWRQRRATTKVGVPPSQTESAPADKSARYGRLRNWLLSRSKGKESSGANTGGAGAQGAGQEDLGLPDLFAADSLGAWAPNTISVKVGPRLFGHLNALQTQQEQLLAAASAARQPTVPASAEVLRQIPTRLPAGVLTQVDENTIELLARIFDFMFQQPQIPDEMKTLLGQLQIPLLKAALQDKKVFVRDDHPARVLMDRLAQSSLAWQPEQGREDPLFRVVEEIIGSVQKDCDTQMQLFSDAAAKLDAFLAEEDRQIRQKLTEPIASAEREERHARSREQAERLIAERVDSGEVPGFVQTFLEQQWSRILALGYNARVKKPDVLDKAIAAMDDLIWSVRPKNSPDDRKNLVTRLPAILSMVNAWLNVIKWEGEERVAFFSELAERHAAIVRTPAELPRHRVEEAVNVAMRAVERNLIRKHNAGQSPVRDAFTKRVDTMEVNDWLRFARSDGGHVTFRLVWISPHRSRFIFARRSGADPFTLKAQAVAAALRDGKATLVESEPVTDRALSAALQE